MRYLGLVAGVVVIGALLWRRDDVATVAESAGEQVSDIFYAVTQDTRANEERYRSPIARAEEQYGIPKGLLHRQLYQESHFRTDIISGATTSGAGAVGIAQIVPKWHPDVDPLDPIASINYAAKIMSQWFRQYGSWSLALAAYNAGPGNVSKYKGVPPFPETQKYVADITSDVGVA